MTRYEKQVMVWEIRYKKACAQYKKSIDGSADEENALARMDIASEKLAELNPTFRAKCSCSSGLGERTGGVPGKAGRGVGSPH